MGFGSDTITGAAWLSSARVVRCWVKSFNERNPCYKLPLAKAKHSDETAWETRRKVGMTSSHHGAYVQGYTRVTMASTKSCKLVKVS